jgi:diguanylate cyclase (GGDEF)-like protein
VGYVGLSGAGRHGRSDEQHDGRPPSWQDPASCRPEKPTEKSNSRATSLPGWWFAGVGVLAALITWGSAALIYASARHLDQRQLAGQRERVLQAIADLRAGIALPSFMDPESARAETRAARRRTFETDSSGRPRAAHADQLDELSPAIRQLMAELNGGYDEEVPLPTEPAPAVRADFMMERDAVWLAVAQRDANPADRTGRIVLSVAPLELVLPELERRSGVSGLVPVAEPNDRMVMQTLTDRHGRIVGWLTWEAGAAMASGVAIWLCILVLSGGILAGLAVLSLRWLRRGPAVPVGEPQRERDAMTGLLSRQSLIDGLDRALADRPEHASVALVHIDAKGFKEINQTLGHQAGDQLLVALADRLHEGLPPTVLLGRLGADEFALVVNGEDADVGLHLAKAIERTLAQPLSAGGHRRQLAVSIGFSQAPRDGLCRDELVLRADMALRAAKKLGRGSIVAFEPGIQAALQERSFLKRELVHALEAGALQLHYQPIVASDGTRVCGLEALVRWTHPTRGAIPPNVFVPIAEQSGLMDELGEFVLRRALADAARWPNLYISVNISPVQMREPSFIDRLAGLIRRVGVEPGRVVLEVTEGVLIDNPDEAQQRLEALRALGVRIALDDFGIGYSSLSYLQRFPFDKLKIDKEFVAPLGRSASGAVIVQSIVGLGRALGLSVVAEGVETEEQRVLLRLAGCNEMQGYLFAKPAPREVIDELVAKAEARSAHVRKARHDKQASSA